MGSWGTLGQMLDGTNASYFISGIAQTYFHTKIHLLILADTITGFNTLLYMLPRPILKRLKISLLSRKEKRDKRKDR